MKRNLVWVALGLLALGPAAAGAAPLLSVASAAVREGDSLTNEYNSSTGRASDPEVKADLWCVQSPICAVLASGGFIAAHARKRRAAVTTDL